jgi:8-oxo-dGTP diphosphatase
MAPSHHSRGDVRRFATGGRDDGQMTAGDVPIRVVAAAIVRDGLLLAARRKPPHRLAGGWEFPGGKVEPGEDDIAALVRECREELAVDVAVDDAPGARLGAADEGGLHIVLYAATIASGEPTAGEDHDALGWLAPDDVDDLDWLPIDRSLLPAAVRALLGPDDHV